MNTTLQPNARRLAVEKAQAAARKQAAVVDRTIKGRRDAQLCRAMGIGFVKKAA